MHNTEPQPDLPEDMLPSWETHGEELDACVRGYPMLAREMERVPETTIFRRFAALNARNLLYFQQELTDMEGRLKQLEYRDSVSRKGWRGDYARDAACLQNSVLSDDSEQWTLMLQIREKLKVYNKALLHQSLLCKLPQPDNYDVTDIRGFIYSPKGMHGPFVGKDADTWGTPLAPGLQASDLVTLRPRQKTDPFSKMVAEKAILYLQWPLRLFQPRAKRMHGLVVYHDGTVLKATYFVTGMLVSLAPILSMFALLNMQNVNLRLGVAAAFNVSIALALQWCTEASRKDIFYVTAAFAAVHVVFVGQALDDGPRLFQFPAGYVLNTTCQA